MNPQKQDTAWWLPGAVWIGEWGQTAYWVQVLFWSDENMWDQIDVVVVQN